MRHAYVVLQLKAVPGSEVFEEQSKNFHAMLFSFYAHF